MLSLSLLKPLALALLATTALADTYAQFCNDDNCSEGCGMAVDVANPGCLYQSGRRSIKFSGTSFGDFSMVASPGPTCDCQNYCEETLVSSAMHVFGPYTPECFTIREEEAYSFRFLEGGCPADQC